MQALIATGVIAAVAAVAVAHFCIVENPLAPSQMINPACETFPSFDPAEIALAVIGVVVAIFGAVMSRGGSGASGGEAV